MTADPEPPPFEPDRFCSAAEHYLHGRAPYAQDLIRRVGEVVGLTPQSRVLDLGCGPAQLARAFAPSVGSVVAMDPSEEMLKTARDLSADFPDIQIVAGSSYDLTPALGPFRLVVMGRSFHWMDRADTLQRLDRMIDRDGAVALFHDSAPDVPANGWRLAWREIQERYAPETLPHRRPGWLRHEGVLLDSAFSRLERFGVIERRPLDVETLARRALSKSSTSPSHLGDRTGAMLDDLRAALADVREEVVESIALVAWRP